MEEKDPLEEGTRERGVLEVGGSTVGEGGAKKSGLMTALKIWRQGGGPQTSWTITFIWRA